jgi:hypothetical protein
VRGLILLMVGTNITAAYKSSSLWQEKWCGWRAHSSHDLHFHRLCAHPSYGRRTGAVSKLILLMEGTNLSAGFVLILLMAGELAQLPGSSF